MAMTREQVAALLEGTTPGPWRKRDCDVVVGEGLTAKTICHFWRHWSNDEEGIEQTEPNVALTAAAPDLARQLIAAMDRLADADMAQAALVERAAEVGEEWAGTTFEGDPVKVGDYIKDSLATDAGVKNLAALRAERDDLRKRVKMLSFMGEGYAFLERDRDRLSAELAEARKQVEALLVASDTLGFWMSAALEDPNVSDEMKADVNAWFAALAAAEEGE